MSEPRISKHINGVVRGDCSIETTSATPSASPTNKQKVSLVVQIRVLALQSLPACKILLILAVARLNGARKGTTAHATHAIHTGDAFFIEGVATCFLIDVLQQHGSDESIASQQNTPRTSEANLTSSSLPPVPPK